LRVAGVDSARRFKQQDMNLLLRYRPMLDTAWNDQEFPLFEPDIAIAEFHSKAPFHDQEQFVFDVVMVPYKSASEFHELHLLAI